MDKFGIFNANQTFMCLIHMRILGLGWYCETSLGVCTVESLFCFISFLYFDLYVLADD